MRRVVRVSCPRPPPSGSASNHPASRIAGKGNGCRRRRRWTRWLSAGGPHTGFVPGFRPSLRRLVTRSRCQRRGSPGDMRSVVQGHTRAGLRSANPWARTFSNPGSRVRRSHGRSSRRSCLVRTANAIVAGWVRTAPAPGSRYVPDARCRSSCNREIVPATGRKAQGVDKAIARDRQQVRTAPPCFAPASARFARVKTRSARPSPVRHPRAIRWPSIRERAPGEVEIAIRLGIAERSVCALARDRCTRPFSCRAGAPGRHARRI